MTMTLTAVTFEHRQTSDGCRWIVLGSDDRDFLPGQGLVLMLAPDTTETEAERLVDSLSTMIAGLGIIDAPAEPSSRKSDLGRTKARAPYLTLLPAGGLA